MHQQVQRQIFDNDDFPESTSTFHIISLEISAAQGKGFTNILDNQTVNGIFLFLLLSYIVYIKGINRTIELPF